MKEKVALEAIDIARLVVEVASEKQAADIVLLDMRGLCDFTDFFVIFTGETQRQTQALLEDVEEALDAAGTPLHHQEGSPDGGWVLLDYGDLIVHAFGPEERDIYQLEQLWSRAPVLLRVQ